MYERMDITKFSNKCKPLIDLTRLPKGDSPLSVYTASVYIVNNVYIYRTSWG